MKPPTRTSVSTDNISAVKDPPIRVTVRGDTDIDVIKSWATVVDAWNASADVLRDVAKAIQENQTDNENTREAIEKNRKVVFAFGVCVVAIQLITAGVLVVCR